MSKHDEDLLQHRIKQLEQAMTYTPSAYTQRHDGKWWIFLTTPSEAIVRLLISYDSQHAATDAIAYLGFRLIRPPKETLTLNRGNTAPR